MLIRVRNVSAIKRGDYHWQDAMHGCTVLGVCRSDCIALKVNNKTVSIRISRNYLINSPLNHKINLQERFNTKSVEALCLNRQFGTRMHVKTATTMVYGNLSDHTI